nr:unnamed protein product [Digitaria exilis]
MRNRHKKSRWRSSSSWLASPLSSLGRGAACLAAPPRSRCFRSCPPSPQPEKEDIGNSRAPPPPQIPPPRRARGGRCRSPGRATAERLSRERARDRERWRLAEGLPRAAAALNWSSPPWSSIQEKGRRSFLRRRNETGGATSGNSGRHAAGARFHAVGTRTHSKRRGNKGRHAPQLAGGGGSKGCWRERGDDHILSNTTFCGKRHLYVKHPSCGPSRPLPPPEFNAFSRGPRLPATHALSTLAVSLAGCLQEQGQLRSSSI